MDKRRIALIIVASVLVGWCIESYRNRSAVYEEVLRTSSEQHVCDICNHGKSIDDTYVCKTVAKEILSRALGR